MSGFRVPRQGERRQVSILFCDLVNSTGLAERLDPEQLRGVFTAYRRCCAQVAGEFGGHVAELQGDGTIVYFGHPEVHEDSAERAVLAGLAMCDRIPLLRTVRSVKLAVRVGIAAGDVVVDGLHADLPKLALGVAPNLAARLEKYAPENGVTVDGSVRELAGDLFQYRSLGQHQLKGLTRPVQIWSIVADSHAASRFFALRGTRMNPLIGRSGELATLRGLWSRAEGGSGQCVLISGEAGIGKSRLVHALLTDSLLTRRQVLQFSFSSYHQGSTLRPLVDLIRTRAGLSAGDDHAVEESRLREWLLTQGIRDAQLQVMFRDLCSIHAVRVSKLGPPGSRQQFLSSLLGLLLPEAHGTEPSLLVFEDLHWADPSTRELLELACMHCASRPVMLLMTSRNDHDLQDATRATLTTLPLNRLQSSEADSLIDLVLGAQHLNPSVRDQILRRSDGIPLFVEEITRMFAERARAGETAGQKFDARSIPSTLQDLLLTRLERGPDVKSVAQVASVIGRDFSLDLLRSILPPQLIPRLMSSLAELEDVGLLLATKDDDVLRFKHVLIQEAAYNSLTRSDRRPLHLSIAQYLVASSRNGTLSKPVDDLIAFHYREARAFDRSFDYWERAGHQATRLASHGEASAHYGKALADLERTSGSIARNEREFKLLTALAAQATIIRGNGHPSVEKLYLRALRIAEEAGSMRRVFRCIRGLQTFYAVRGEVTKALDYGLRLLEIAGTENDPSLMLHAHRPQALCYLYLGQFEQSRDHALKTLDLYDRERDAADRFIYGSDTCVLAHANLAWAEHFLGNDAAGMEHARHAVDFAGALEHPHSMAFALAFEASLAQFMFSMEQAGDAAERLIALSVRHEFAYWRAWGAVLKGWSRMSRDSGNAADAIAGALHDYCSTGARLMIPYFLTLLGEARILAGDATGALGCARKAERASTRTQVRFYVNRTHEMMTRALACIAAKDGIACAARMQVPLPCNPLPKGAVPGGGPPAAAHHRDTSVSG